MEKDSGQMHINIIGHCDNCGKYTSRSIGVRVDKSSLAPSECEHCHRGTVNFERLEVHHIPPKDKENSIDKTFFWILRGILILAFVTGGVCLYIGIKLHKAYTTSEMSAAMATTASMSTPAILIALYEAGIRESSLSEILAASRFTLRRIMSGETIPTPNMDANIRGIYTDYLLLESRFLFLTKYSLYKNDPWYAFKNPLQEQDIIPSSSIETDGVRSCND